MRRENAKLYPPSLRGAKRRSNPSIPALRRGLLRCARNDEERAVARMSAATSGDHSNTAPDIASLIRATSNSIASLRAMTGRAGVAPCPDPEEAAKERGHQRGDQDCPRNRLENPSGQNVAFLQCSNTVNVAPANGQWQFDPLLCIGATGIQASERALRKKIRGRKHA